MKNLCRIKLSICILFVIVSVSVFARAELNEALNFSLSDDENSSVIATFDGENNTIVISGSGTIDRVKWFNFAKSFGDGSYWDINDDVNLTFVGDEKSIYLPEDSSRLFYNFQGNIYFADVVNTHVVVDMTSMFYNCKAFNSDISKWNTENVSNMSSMFKNCSKFTSDISSWNTERVTDMSSMFSECSKFSSDLSAWNVGNVSSMSYMFYGCSNFNSNIGSWNVGNVTSMAYMFSSCRKFHSDLSLWRTDNVTNMDYMFYECDSFSSNLSDWNVGNVSSMDHMFRGCEQFNSDLSMWNTTKVENMNSLFKDCESFDSDLSKWDTDNVSNMRYMFAGATSLKSVDFSNRRSLAEGMAVGNIFYDLNPDAIKFDCFPGFTWKLAQNYWIKIGQGKPVFVNKEALAGRPYTFSANTRYELNIREIPHLTATDFTKYYDEETVLAEQISKSAMDSSENLIEGSWTLEGIGSDLVDEGSYRAKLIFTPCDTDRYASTSIELSVTIEKATPSGLKAWQGQSLSDIRLPLDDEGIWHFVNPDIQLNCVGSSEHDIVFTPYSDDEPIINRKVLVEVLDYSEDEEETKDDSDSDDKEDVVDVLDGDNEEIPESEKVGPFFDDVNEDDWFYDSVNRLYKLKIINGISREKYLPASDVSRAMVISVIYSLADRPEVNGLKTIFADIKKNSYYEVAVLWGRDKGVIVGRGGLFEPDVTISREEMITILYRYHSLAHKSVIDEKAIDKFDDGDKVSEYAKEAMNWAVSEQLISGKVDDKLSPREWLNRAELAVILDRYIQFLE